jgi:hypothetical protein
MKSIIKKVLREENEPTETPPLYLELPKNLVNKLGFKLFGNQDVVYIYEIHFDTQNVLFIFFHKLPSGEEIWYGDSRVVPMSFRDEIAIPILELPKDVIIFILRRLSPEYVKYLKL